MSSLLGQAGWGLTITNLRAEFPKALLVAVRLQLLAFAWKPYLSVLRTDQIASEGWSHQLSMNWCRWRRYKKLVNGWLKTDYLTVMPFLWQCSASHSLWGQWLCAAHPKGLISCLTDFWFEPQWLWGNFSSSGLVLSFVHCPLGGLTRNLRTVKFPTQGLQSTFAIAQRHQQKFIKPFLCGFLMCSRKG